MAATLFWLAAANGLLFLRQLVGKVQQRDLPSLARLCYIRDASTCRLGADARCRAYMQKLLYAILASIILQDSLSRPFSEELEVFVGAEFYCRMSVLEC